MLHVVTWLWRQNGYRSQFESAHVNTLRRMVARHLSVPHDFICLTDMPEGLDPEIRALPMPKVPEITVKPDRPNCFRRLWAFSAEASDVIGPRFLSLDLDVVITADITPLVCRPDQFVMYGDTARRTTYNGSLLLMTAGSRRQVWDQFKGAASYRETQRLGMIGSDQAWISHVLGPGESVFTRSDGVYSFRNEIARRWPRDLPTNARIVVFHGKPDPWQASVQRDFPWIKDHYR